MTKFDNPIITFLLQNYCKDITNTLNSTKLLCKIKNICLNIGISCKSKKQKKVVVNVKKNAKT